MTLTPYWATERLPRFPSLESDLDVDVVIVGGGLTGITTAYLLSEAGVKVGLFERGRCAGADTGHTTAHLTFVTDYRLRDLVKNFGRDDAKLFWNAGALAIDEIERIVGLESIDCQYSRVPGYLHAREREAEEKELESLREDAELAGELGFNARFRDAIPYAGSPGVEFGNQAKFHPLRYLSHLLGSITRRGGKVYEESEVTAIEADPLAVKVGSHNVRCRFVVVATHNPIAGKTPLLRATLFQTKLSLYTSYVVGARVPAGTIPEALYWDTGDPYYYMRVDRGRDEDYVIFGGEDTKTGQGDDAESLRCVEEYLNAHVAGAKITHRWMGQVIETNDGLPFIGEIAENQFVATGFCGNGFTLGTLAAMMARDRVVQGPNDFTDLFNVGRRKIIGGAARYVAENIDYPIHLVKDHLAGAEAESVRDLAPGEGKIVMSGGHKVAAYRDPSGTVTKLSPVCTHMGCIVHWNSADSTWDCPCHGSRFGTNGDVISGPAEDALKRA